MKPFFNGQQIHTFKTYPWALWLLSLVLILVGCALTYYSIKAPNKEKISFLLVLFNVLVWYIAFLILYSTNIEKLTINKKKGLVIHTKISILCKKQQETNLIDDLEDIELVLRGIVNRSTDTSRYMVRLMFRCKKYVSRDNDGTYKKLISEKSNAITFGDTVSFDVALKKYRIALAMLRGVVLENVGKEIITDETTDGSVMKNKDKNTI